MICRLLRFNIHSLKSLFSSFWLGWALVIIILQLWHLHFRIDWRIFVLISTAGTVGLLWNWKTLRYLLVKEKIPKSWLFWIIILIVSFLFANHSFGPITHYDMGLYHLQAVRWATQYPIVPGLGNLHNRLAFNNSHFLYVALLGISPWFPGSHHLANGLLLLVLFTQIFLSTFKMLSKLNYSRSHKLLNNSEKLQINQLFEVLLLAPVLNIILSGSASNISPDVPIFILGIILSSKLLELLTNSKDSKEVNFALFFIVIVASVGITVKLNFAVLGVSASFLALYTWWKKIVKLGSFNSRKIVVCIFLSVLLIVVPWMIRGIILSGYVAFPSTIGSLPLEWRVPSAVALELTNWMRSWARKPGVHWNEVLGNWDWLKPWIHRMLAKRNIFDFVIPLGLAIGGIFLPLLFRNKNNLVAKRSVLYWFFLFPPILNIIFWFFVVPMIRYAGSSFWILGAGTIALAVAKLSKLKRIITVLFISLLFLTPLGIFEQILGGERLLISEFHTIPIVKLSKFETRSGLVVYIPKKGDQCWNAKLPCTPYPNPDLRLRKEGNISKGFIVEAKTPKGSVRNDNVKYLR